ncbi:hypothetical protein EON80_22635, partial [bacterium]
MNIKPSTLVSDDLSRQLEVAHVEFTVGRVQGIAERPGNPYDAHVTHFGNGVALTANLPLDWVNTIHILGQPDMAEVKRIVATYHALKRLVRLEIL